MLNAILIVIIMMISLSLILLSFRRGLSTLYVLIAVLYVITNLSAAKIVVVNLGFFSFPASVAAPLYASLFLATDMIAESYGKPHAYKAIWFGFGSQIVLLIFGVLLNLFSADAGSEIANALNVIFSFTPRLVAASLLAYVVSQNFDIWFFHKIKEITEGKYPALRNILSTVCAQFIDTFIVFVVAFYGVLDDWFAVMLSTYIIKVIVALCDTPFFLISRRVAKPLAEQRV